MKRVGPFLRRFAHSNFFDLAVLKVSLEASTQLFLMCVFLVYLMKARLLPESTPSILSQLAFRVCIPCYLMSKGAVLVSSETSIKLLALPLVALLQIGMGAVLGIATWEIFLFFRRTRGCGKLRFGKFWEILGYRSSMSYTTLHVFGSAESLLQQKDVSANAERNQENKKSSGFQNWNRRNQAAIVTAACAFGNSGVLPLVFVSGLLGKVASENAGGYLALYLIGWSPGFWTVGYQIIVGAAKSAKSQEHSEEPQNFRGKVTVILRKIWEVVQQILNPPMYGILIGLLVGLSPLSSYSLPLASLQPTQLAAASTPLGQWLSSFLRPVFDGAATLGSGFTSVSFAVFACSLATAVPSASEAYAKIVKGIASIRERCGRLFHRFGRVKEFQYEQLERPLYSDHLPSHSGTLASSVPNVSSQFDLRAQGDAGKENHLGEPVVLNAATWDSRQMTTMDTLEEPTTCESILGNAFTREVSVQELELGGIAGHGLGNPTPLAMSGLGDKENLPVTSDRNSAKSQDSPQGAALENGETQQQLDRRVLGSLNMDQNAKETLVQSSNPIQTGTEKGASVSLTEATTRSEVHYKANTLKDGDSGAKSNQGGVSETHALLVICFVRMLLLPSIGAVTMLALSAANVIPPGPLCLLLFMVQMCMPCAQNLILVAQLKKETRDMASFLSSLMLQQYALSILPITIWTSIFLTLAQQSASR